MVRGHCISTSRPTPTGRGAAHTSPSSVSRATWRRPPLRQQAQSQRQMTNSATPAARSAPCPRVLSFLPGAPMSPALPRLARLAPRAAARPPPLRSRAALMTPPLLPTFVLALDVGRPPRRCPSPTSLSPRPTRRIHASGGGVRHYPCTVPLQRLPGAATMRRPDTCHHPFPRRRHWAS